jgi:transposase-like protein
MGRQPDRKRKHSPSFKVEAVRLMRERLASGLTLQRVSEELELSPDLLRVWARHVDSAATDASAEQIFPGSGRPRNASASPNRESSRPAAPLSAEAEVAQLRRENERLRQERDFLKKATAFFARESR